MEGGVPAGVDGDELLLEALFIGVGFDGSHGFAVVFPWGPLLVLEVVIPGVDGFAGDGDAAALVERAVLDAQLLGHGGGQELGVVAGEGVTWVFLRQFIEGGVEEYASVDAALLQ